ncbi:hypothetical protein PRZ48_008689 [Zasmidium cellare]|uniref:Uncharacterized protein n=1 Tax=Zasmidium cellare TaxID=395010 RepID=A0ABR0EGT8_ZASCE|nr:hypothetical protein PRZ48_008689 [Zasmidium cellare]
MALSSIAIIDVTMDAHGINGRDTDFIPTLYSCFEEFQDWYAAWYQFFMAFFDSSVHGFDVHKELLNFLSYPSHWTSELYSMYRVDNKCPKEFWDRYAQSRPRCCNLPGKSAKFRKAQYFLMLSLSECPLIRNRRAWEINSNGRVDLAWLPKEAQTGDQICLFAGAVWPFVVRPVGDDNYRLIGDCHTYSTPLIEALGGTYDVDKHGDGHVHNYFRGPGGEGWESEEPGSSEELGSEQSGSEQSGSEESGSDEADSEETSSGKTDSEEAKYEELEGEESESEELGGASETESGEPGRKGPESDVDEESIIEGSESDVDRDMTDGTLSPQVRFVRGERLSFNMRGLLDDEPSLRYDEYIEQMDYLAPV